MAGKDKQIHAVKLCIDGGDFRLRQLHFAGLQIFLEALASAAAGDGKR